MTQSLHINSIKDARVVEAHELTSAAGRARLQKTQLEGEESIRWALEAHLPVEHVFYSANLRQRAFLETLEARGVSCYEVSDGVLKKISATSYLVPVIGIARLPSASGRPFPWATSSWYSIASRTTGTSERSSARPAPLAYAT